VKPDYAEADRNCGNATPHPTPIVVKVLEPVLYGVVDPGDSSCGTWPLAGHPRRDPADPWSGNIGRDRISTVHEPDSMEFWPAKLGPSEQA
jgi:hypothetical protein